MASIRTNLTDNASACVVLACQVLTDAELRQVYELIGEQLADSRLKQSATAVTQLADAATALVAIEVFATALGTAGWEESA